jgi:hypothetical protein
MFVVFFAALLLQAAAASAAPVPANPEPLTDKMRLQVAISQRDYLLAQSALDRAKASLESQSAVAGKACASAGKTFDGAALACVAKKDLAHGNLE